MEFKGGKLIDFSKTSSNRGTKVTVRNLFSNVPARRKFLKSDPVEFKHILNYLHYQSILYPKIHFRFLADGKEKLNYPAVTEMQARMSAVFGSDFQNRDLIEVSTKGQDLELTGFISGLNEEKEGLADYRYLFVNLKISS